MKASLTLLAAVAGALTLAAGAASAAISPSSVHRVAQAATWVDGSEYEQAMKFISTRSAAEVRAEAIAANRGVSFVDGSEYEKMMKFMSTRTAAEVRTEAVQSSARFSAAALSLNGGF